MPYQTRARGGGRVGTNTSPRGSQSPPPEPRLVEDDDVSDEDSADETKTSGRKKRKRKTRIALPTIHNYHEVGLEWGQVRAERILARQPHIKTRTPPTTLFEAQALQAQYNLDKTMLCIAEGISRSTLDASLHEGPLAREPNRYTNYQTYSIVSTTTPMPPKGQSAGFKQRNAIVGNAWSSYSDDEKDVFSPRLFERLIQALMKEADPLLAPEPTSTSPIEADADELTDEDKAQYLPLFKNLVNMRNVKRDFKNGQLCRHSGTPNRVEKVGIEEIKKVVEQLHLIHNKFRFQFHLLVSAWHPNTTMTRALYQDEFTSCERWAVHARSEFHLLERFALESTQAPPNTKKKNKKTDSATATHQDCLRKELTTCLNGLVQAHLPGGRQSKSDTHPQGPNPHLIILERKYRGEIFLAVERLPDSQVTDEMLARGSRAGQLPDAQVQVWIDDIKAGRYLIVKPPHTAHAPSASAEHTSNNTSNS